MQPYLNSRCKNSHRSDGTSFWPGESTGTVQNPAITSGPCGYRPIIYRPPTQPTSAMVYLSLDATPVGSERLLSALMEQVHILYHQDPKSPSRHGYPLTAFVVPRIPCLRQHQQHGQRQMHSRDRQPRLSKSNAHKTNTTGYCLSSWLRNLSNPKIDCSNDNGLAIW
jgi:hypothetical protein